MGKQNMHGKSGERISWKMTVRKTVRRSEDNITRFWEELNTYCPFTTYWVFDMTQTS
jgi:hypothetical protein